MRDVDPSHLGSSMITYKYIKRLDSNTAKGGSGSFSFLTYNQRMIMYLQQKTPGDVLVGVPTLHTMFMFVLNKQKQDVLDLVLVLYLA